MKCSWQQRGALTRRSLLHSFVAFIQTFPRESCFTTLGPAVPFATVCETDPQGGHVLLLALAPVWNAAERGALQLPSKGGHDVPHAGRAEPACITGELSRAHITASMFGKG